MSTKQFSLLSTSSMASLILPFMRLSSQHHDKEKTTLSGRFLQVLQWSLQDERVFGVFFKEQCQLMRQLYRFAALSEKQDISITQPQKDKKHQNQCAPVLVWLVQELCSLQDIFVAKTDATTSLSSTGKKAMKQDSSTKNSVSTLQDSLGDSLAEEDATSATAVPSKASTSVDSSSVNNHYELRFEMLKQPLQLQISPLQSKVEVIYV